MFLCSCDRDNSSWSSPRREREHQCGGPQTPTIVLIMGKTGISLPQARQGTAVSCPLLSRKQRRSVASAWSGVGSTKGTQPGVICSSTTPCRLDSSDDVCSCRRWERFPGLSGPCRSGERDADTEVLVHRRCMLLERKRCSRRVDAMLDKCNG